MADINIEKILTGTPEKRYNIALLNMRNNYNQTTAEDFFNTYKMQPLSFILNNSRSIFSEPYYGLGFYKNLIDNHLIPVYRYQEELDKIVKYITDSKDVVDEKQLELYKSLKDRLLKKKDLYTNTIRMCDIAKQRNCCDYMNQFYDAIYDAECNNDDELFTDTINTLSNISDPYTFFIISSQMLSRYPETGVVLSPKMKSFCFRFKHDMNPEYLKRTMESVDVISSLYKDSYIKEAIDNSSNINMKIFYENMAYSNTDTFKNMISSPVVSDKESYVSTTTNLFNRIYEMGNNDSYMIDDSFIIERYDRLLLKRAFYEYQLDHILLTDPENITLIESYEDAIMNTDDEIDMMEWTKEGEPDPIIKAHSQTKKEKEDEEEERRKEEQLKKEKKKHRLLRLNKHGKAEEVEDEKDDEDDDNDLSDSSDSSNDDEDMNKKDDENDDDLSDIVEPVTEGLVSSIKSKFKKDDKNDNDNSDDDSDEESDEESDEQDGPEPVKPKPGITEKIQNKALDHEAKRKAKQAERKEKIQHLKNAGNAVSTKPKEDINSIQRMRDKFDDWDDSRRKKFLAKPGYRKNLWKKFKLALLYGGAAKANILYVPVAQMLRHFSKQKDRRIRNELDTELKNEIEIVNSKIEDAAGRGDNKEKYNLMRIKNKLEAEQKRVALNSKYI